MAMKKKKKTPKRWGFLMFQCFFFFFFFFFFFIFAFFCLSFSSLPLLLDIFKPKNGPPNEVLGYFLNVCLSLSPQHYLVMRRRQRTRSESSTGMYRGTSYSTGRRRGQTLHAQWGGPLGPTAKCPPHFRVSKYNISKSSA